MAAVSAVQKQLLGAIEAGSVRLVAEAIEKGADVNADVGVRAMIHFLERRPATTTIVDALPCSAHGGDAERYDRGGCLPP